jgi:hypothetical protein
VIPRARARPQGAARAGAPSHGSHCPTHPTPIPIPSPLNSNNSPRDQLRDILATNAGDGTVVLQLAKSPRVYVSMPIVTNLLFPVFVTAGGVFSPPILLQLPQPCTALGCLTRAATHTHHVQILQKRSRRWLLVTCFEILVCVVFHHGITVVLSLATIAPCALTLLCLHVTGTAPVAR